MNPAPAISARNKKTILYDDGSAALFHGASRRKLSVGSLILAPWLLMQAGRVDGCGGDGSLLLVALGHWGGAASGSGNPATVGEVVQDPPAVRPVHSRRGAELGRAAFLPLSLVLQHYGLKRDVARRADSNGLAQLPLLVGEQLVAGQAGDVGSLLGVFPRVTLFA